MREIFRPGRMWRRRGELRDAYDVVIVGGGVHGLATAYYLGQLGVKNVAVLEKSYIGSGAAGRNTTILGSNHKTPAGARFYDASIRLYEGLAAELECNLLFSQCGHLTLAHSDRAMFVMANRAEVNRLHGIDSQLVDVAEVGRLCPQLNVSEDAIYPIKGALYHPPGGITSATTPSSGATPAGPTAPGSRSTPTPRSRASSARVAGSPPCGPIAEPSRPVR